MMIKINYKASGKLVCCVEIPETNDLHKPWYYILVDKGNEYVVSMYRDSMGEWLNGRYFPSYKEALEIFLASVSDRCFDKQV